MSDQVVAVDPRSNAHWERLASGSMGSVFTSPPWIEALCAEYGFHPEGRLLGTGDDVRAGFCWIPIDDLRGARAVSLPFSDRADPMVPDLDAWQLVAADALAPDVPLALRCFDDSPVATARGLAPAGKLAWHETPLEGAESDLHASFSSSARRALRAGEARGVRVSLRADRAAVADFHALHVALRRDKYRLLAQPISFFEHIWEAFAPGDLIVTALAEVDGAVVAGAIYLVWGDTLYYKFGASTTDGLSHRPNEMIVWSAMRWARERGLVRLDWGVSDLDQPGLLAFKRKWGGRERRVVSLRHPSAWPAGRDELGGVLRELTGVLTDPSVPDPVAARAGEILYRYFT